MLHLENMKPRHFLPVLALACFASNANASINNASISPVQAPPVTGFGGLQVAQAGAIKPSTLRRLQFYADKVRAALSDLAREDQAASAGTALNSTTTDTLRTNIERLIDAGTKAGLTIAQTTDFFDGEMLAKYSGPLPLIVQDANGNLDALQLFQGVALNKQSRSNATAEADYLAMVTAAGTEAQGGTATSPPAPVLSPTAGLDTVQRDPEVQAFWDRLKITNGKRTITVQSGDTLATFADAFYGDSLLYRRIYAANEAVLDTPNLLEVGVIITIPQ